MIRVTLKPETTQDELDHALNQLRARGHTPRRSGDGWIARCVTHDDTTASLSLARGKNGNLITHCHAGCTREQVWAELGIPNRKPNTEPRTTPRRLVETYPYTDEHGTLLYEVLRYEPKAFTQRLADGTPRLGDIRRVLYRLPSVLAAAQAHKLIYIVEGEKDVHAVEQAGAIATTWAGGANAWRDEYADHLHGATIFIVCDRDAAGDKCAASIVQSLIARNMTFVCKVAATGKDVSDHLNAGLELAELLDPETTDIPTTDDKQLAWTPLDLITLGDTPRTPPEISNLIYKARRHLLTGESESGKTWLGFAIASDELKAGYGAVWVDLDYMGAQDILERLRQFGVKDDAIRERFSFYQPDGPLEGPNLEAVTNLIHQTNARTVIIDAFTGFCALHNLKPNDGIDIEHAYRLMQPLCDTQAAIIIIDHVVKDPTNRGRYASGSERKLSGADIAIGFTLIHHYGRGTTGQSRLTVHKDRPAQLNRPTAGIFTLASDPQTHQVAWSIQPDDSHDQHGQFRPTTLMQRISLYLESQDQPANQRTLQKDIRGNSKALRAALKTLTQEGYLDVQEAPRGEQLYSSKHPYREDHE